MPAAIALGAQNNTTLDPRFAQVDHLDEWTRHGTTALDNAAVLCERHNRLKHRAGWTGRRRPDGHLNWYRSDGTEMRAIGRPHEPDVAEITELARRRLEALIPLGGTDDPISR